VQHRGQLTCSARGNTGSSTPITSGPILRYAALQNMVIWILGYSRLSQLISMNATVRLMVVDAQETLAVRKLAFPATGRSLQFFCHPCSYKVNHRKEKLQKVSRLRLQPKDVWPLRHVSIILHYGVLWGNIFLISFPSAICVRPLARRTHSSPTTSCYSAMSFHRKPRRANIAIHPYLMDS